jgi:hypothetical protein
MFSYTALTSFLLEAKAAASVFPLRDFAGQPGIIMRHDVDLDIVPAYRLAQIEKDAGIRASFFFLMSSDTYNPASGTNRALLRDMAEEGFEIGLHFDPTIYPDADHDTLGHLEKLP